MADFEAINRVLLSTAESLLAQWLPGGRRVGHEYVCASLEGGEGRSTSVNLNTGAWADFAGNAKGGDLVSLYANIHHLNNGEAARQLCEQYAIPKANGHSSIHPTIGNVTAFNNPTIERTVPDGIRPPSFVHRTHGKASRVWTYRNANGLVMMHVARYDMPGSRKSYSPWVWSGTAWKQQGYPDPQPLYGLDDLALRPNAGVVMVEGEKCADAARLLMPDQVVVTWPGGAKRWHKVDLTPLYGRRILFWPDNDQPGTEAMLSLAQRLAAHCEYLRIIRVDDMPKAWDAADAVEDGWTTDKFVEWVKSRIQEPGAPNTALEVQPDPIPPVLEESRVVIGFEAPARITDFNATWMKWGMHTSGGNALPTLHNATTVLEMDPHLKDLVWFDDFLQRFQTRVNDGTARVREWCDNDDIRLTLYMQREVGIQRMGAEVVAHAVREVAYRRRRHGVKDWLLSLKWDNRLRCDSFFVDNFGAVDSAYARAVSRNFWLSIIARVFRPGCKVDNMVVLEGEQGTRKSMALSIIGGEWFTEQHESVTSRAFFEVIQGKLLVEVGEMDAFNRADITKVKQVVTCNSDRYREPYQRYAQDHPRQCIFAGTTNRDDWGKDETGARRFWPIRCRVVNIEEIEKWRDQYFAEAVVRLNPAGEWNPHTFHFNNGEPWWEMPGKDTVEEQKARYLSGVWDDMIEEFVKTRSDVSLAEIFAECIKLEPSRIARKDELAVAAALRSIGWKRVFRRIKNSSGDWTTKRIWQPPDEEKTLL